MLGEGSRFHFAGAAFQSEFLSFSGNTRGHFAGNKLIKIYAIAKANREWGRQLEIFRLQSIHQLSGELKDLCSFITKSPSFTNLLPLTNEKFSIYFDVKLFSLLPTIYWALVLPHLQLWKQRWSTKGSRNSARLRQRNDPTKCAHNKIQIVPFKFI